MTLLGPQGQQLGGISELDHKMMMAEQRQAEAINMHFSTALQLFARWALPSDDPATVEDKVKAAARASTQFLKVYGYAIQLKALADDTTELEGKEPTKDYTNQD